MSRLIMIAALCLFAVGCETSPYYGNGHSSQAPAFNTWGVYQMNMALQQNYQRQQYLQQLQQQRAYELYQQRRIADSLGQISGRMGGVYY